DVLVIALGATEQHGPHLPLGTDALIGDHLARLVADRLDAFVGPTIRIGFSDHHLEFAGTLSISEQTFSGIITDVVTSAARSGFRRLVLLPTHGGNFGPLAAALDQLTRRWDRGSSADRPHRVARARPARRRRVPGAARRRWSARRGMGDVDARRDPS